MRYAIADRAKAAAHGVSCAGHRVKGARIVLNEKELMSLPGADIGERAAAVGGEVYTRTEIKEILKREGWDE